MKTPIAKAESVLAFLRFKGWEVEKKTNVFYIMKPPPSITPSDFRLQFPHLEDARAYKVVITEIVKDTANLYEWNEWALLKLLSKSPEEVEKVLKQGLVLQEGGKMAVAA